MHAYLDFSKHANFRKLEKKRSYLLRRKKKEEEEENLSLFEKIIKIQGFFCSLRD